MCDDRIAAVGLALPAVRASGSGGTATRCAWCAVGGCACWGTRGWAGLGSLLTSRSDSDAAVETPMEDECSPPDMQSRELC